MHRTLPLSAALLLAATAAQAGYYERVPNTPSGHYIPSQEEQERAYRQQVIQNQERIIYEQRIQDLRQMEMEKEIRRLKANQDWR